MGDDPPSPLSEDPLPMGVVDVDHRPVLPRQRGDPVEGRDVSVHREDAVRDHEDPSVGRGVLFGGRKDLPEVLDVGVVVDGPLRARKTDAVDDAPVVELVADDEVPLADELGDEARIRREAALVDERRLGMLELCEAVLELDVEVHVPGDWTDRTGADAVGLHGPRRRVLEAADGC